MFVDTQAYIRTLKTFLDLLPYSIIRQFSKMLTKDRQIFICGNGGSAATASHMATDLSKKGLRVTSLNDNVALLTALANDADYENIFKGQLYNLANSGDLLIAISASGNSKNILNALEFAREQDMETVCLLGFDGGQAAKLVDLSIIVPSDNYGIIEDIHLIINHILVNCADLCYNN